MSTSSYVRPPSSSVLRAKIGTCSRSAPFVEARRRRWALVVAVGLAALARRHRSKHSCAVASASFANIRIATEATSTARSTSAASRSAAIRATATAAAGGRLSSRRHQPVHPPVGADQDHRQHGRRRQANHLLMQLTVPEFFNCPFIMMTEVGRRRPRRGEAGNLRDYLLKGGFLWADDFWGTDAWDWWAAQMRTVLPADRISDRRPATRLTRCSTRSSMSRRRRRSPTSAHWSRYGGGTRSAAPTAPRARPARSSTSTAGSWC